MLQQKLDIRHIKPKTKSVARIYTTGYAAVVHEADRGTKYDPQLPMRVGVRRLLEAAPKSVLIDVVVDLLTQRLGEDQDFLRALFKSPRVPFGSLGTDDVHFALKPHYKARRAAIKKRRAAETATPSL